jgi:hypothetical protein
VCCGGAAGPELPTTGRVAQKTSAKSAAAIVGWSSSERREKEFSFTNLAAQHLFQSTSRGAADAKIEEGYRE